MTDTLTRPVEVGDIFASSWGYDQTNVDFYEVVGVTASGKSVRLVPVRSEVVEDNGPSVTVKAVPGSADPDAKPVTKRLRYYSGEAVVTLTSYSNAWHTDPDRGWHATGYGWGH